MYAMRESSMVKRQGLMARLHELRDLVRFSEA